VWKFSPYASLRLQPLRMYHVTRSSGTAHTQWLQTHCQWWPMADITTHTILKLGGGIDHVTHHNTTTVFDVKRLKVKVTKSRNVSAAKTL